MLKTCRRCSLDKPITAFEKQRAICYACRYAAKKPRESRRGKCKKCGKRCEAFICESCQRTTRQLADKAKRQEKVLTRWGVPVYVHPAQLGVPLGKKRCPKCDKIFPRTREFFTGRFYMCRTCNSKYNKRFRKPKGPPKRTRRDSLTWTCTSCRTELPNTREFFKPRADRPGHLFSRCWGCYSKDNKKRLELCTPKWLTDEQRAALTSIYAEARRLTQETGIPHEVDHIEPVRGKDRRGLHVPWNLRILTKQENRQAYLDHVRFCKSIEAN